jgi:hypothetical protein
MLEDEDNGTQIYASPRHREYILAAVTELFLHVLSIIRKMIARNLRNSTGAPSLTGLGLARTLIAYNFPRLTATPRPQLLRQDTHLRISLQTVRHLLPAGILLRGFTHAKLLTHILALPIYRHYGVSVASSLPSGILPRPARAEASPKIIDEAQSAQTIFTLG